ncbi:MAG: TonB-dependent receptor [Bacteroidetes bacterium]|nr:TonB-dependent receptor [Bacteroidota bacterium]
MRKKLLLSLVIMSSFFYSSLFAGNTGKISGRVTDLETGEPLPFANVFIDGTSQGAAADIDGYYTILNIPPGVYSVTASIVGFQKKTIIDVRVNIDFTTRLNFELNLGSIEMEAVIVQGERNPLIRQDLTNPQFAITSEQIDELPVDQISDLIKLQAGIVVGDDGEIHIRGGYANETAYTLNGISLNDPYGNRSSVGLATNAVQEVSVSSGTFTAEYGNALSGVVNYVTKEGSNKITFSLRGYSGDYLTNNTDLYFNMDDIDPLNRGRLEATLGGPIPETNNKVKVFFSSVYENFKGSYYGIRLYNPTDSYLSREAFQTGDARKATSTLPYYFNPYSANSDGTPTGDGKVVAMNPSTSFNIQGNIIYNISSLLKIKYEAVYDKSNSKNYSFQWKFNPDGVGTNYSDGLIQTLDFTHTVNEKLFYTLKASYGFNNYRYYLYENRNDERYLPSEVYQLGIANTGFVAGGTVNTRTNRRTSTFTSKGDLVAQMFKNHEMKAGYETRIHNLRYENYSVKIRDQYGTAIDNIDLLYDTTLVISRTIPDSKTERSLITTYKRYPIDGAIYVQDKIELDKSLILNLGLRYEYFDPKAYYNPDLSADLLDLKSGYISRGVKKAEVQQYLSPRISVSYPITERGVIRFSYGHFYQNGSLSSLYSNPDFFVANVGSSPSFGNANVNMQRSVQYELGLQQQLGDDFKMELTGYYKDVRDYIQTQDVYTSSGRKFSVLTNLAYSNVRGITLRFEKRRTPADMFYATLDYTFMVAEGNRTEPDEDLFFSEESGKQTETYLVPLSFDRPHVVNATLGLYKPDNWAVGIIANLQAGKPYTPAFPSQLVPITFEQNSGYQPAQWNVNLKFEKFFEFGPFKYSIFIHVENLLDTENELSVYASTGRSLKTVDEAINPNQFNDIKRRINADDPGLFGIEEIDGYYTDRPDRVNRPREVRLGFTILFN